MDSNLTIKPSTGVKKTFGLRDPVPVREAVETELDAAKSVTAAGDDGAQQHSPRHEHAPQEMVADPESREIINRENDIRASAVERDHPDQALLRQRAYQPARNSAEIPAAPEPHANIKA